MHEKTYMIEILDSISAIEPSHWAALVEHESPFLDYHFLRLLESTGCTGELAGWYPQILVAYEEPSSPEAPKHVVGALPFYVKTNSAGEFIFDWSWADAAYRAGIDYYPKAVVAIPFSPVSARKVLVSPDLPEEQRTQLGKAMIAASMEIAQKQDLSSVHYNFLQPDEVELFDEFPTYIRHTMQYHWQNDTASGQGEPYKDFDHFLQRFRSKRRANIRRERRKLKQQGVTTEILRGDDITEELMATMFGFYLNTIDKFYYGQQYLTEDFFLALPEYCRDDLHIVIAKQNGEAFAGAFNLYKHDRLYGRYWGCSKDVEFAHFEVCMYTPIEWCIEHGVMSFEPGAGGEHKYERGFEPTKIYSAHFIRDFRLSHGIERFLAQERAARTQQIKQMRALNPFKD